MSAAFPRSSRGTGLAFSRRGARGLGRCAFTLIEVLVVVAIIAVLAAILIPSLSEARDQARSARCLANMKDMGTGMNTFAAGRRNRFQVLANVSSVNTDNTPARAFSLTALGDPTREHYAYETGTAAGTPNLLGWPVVLAREAGARGLKRNLDWGVIGGAGAANAIARKNQIPRFEVLSCPADKQGLNTFGLPSSTGADVVAEYVYGCLSYGINNDIAGIRRPVTPGPNTPGVWKEGKTSYNPAAGENLRGRLDAVVRPSEVMMFVDAGIGDTKQQNLNQPGAPTFLSTAGPTTANFAQVPVGPLLEYVDRVYGHKLRHERHRRASLNLAYADGHGGFVKRISRGNPFWTQGGPSQIPDWIYLPKVRVSPYDSGAYPALPP